MASHSLSLLLLPLLLALTLVSSSPVQDPDLVVQDVHRSINASRRNLAYLSCGTGNPIDDCWRCDSNWEQNRQRLADCAIGFGKNALGGRNGQIYVVTDSGDDDAVNPKPGTLRHAVIQDEPLWIIFKRDMVSNIIIHGIHIHDCKQGGNAIIRDSPQHAGHWTVSDGDGVSIFAGKDIWVDHCSLSNCNDGLIDAIHGSTAITISNNYMTHHDKVMLLGHDDAYTDDKNMQVTKHEDAPESEWSHWNWRSEGDLMQNGAYFRQSGAGASSTYARASSLSARPASFVGAMTTTAGALGCRIGSRC
ncbi:hypothetical protein RHGRI_022781 [Rhododendron griersonianum]|uniref:Pectate lyase n=1 Tax=Rhododendron griersonianum TaxID=479676 RepID=A0AAV6J5S2_9ERIC|nr:hypothetical protein RHGRI_022781 [Rhododendron griersonianum]